MSSWWIIALFSSTVGLGEAVYPPSIPIRLLGTDQQETGSCAAEADVTAIEHALAFRNYPVQLSTFHRHAFNRASDLNPEETKSIVLQTYEEGDRQFLLSGSSFWPLYLWPEDATGYPRAESRFRPAVKTHAVPNSGIPNLAIGARMITFQRPPGGSVWRDAEVVNLDILKSYIRQRVPITFSVHGRLMGMMDRGTGLLQVPYSRSLLPADNNTFVNDETRGLNHSVAPVGFDDSLYNGQGALIVRNSWNSLDELRTCQVAEQSENPKVQDDLKRLRLKIASVNLPGYYAVPYAYYRDLMNFPPFFNASGGIGSGRRFDVDYNQVYSVYSNNIRDTEVFNVPFVCDRESWDGIIADYDRLKSRLNMPTGDKELIQFLQRQIFSLYPTVRFARLPVNMKAGVDRVKDFAEGKMWSYYCADFPFLKDHFPTAEEAVDPRFHQILTQFQISNQSITVWNQFLAWASCRKRNQGVCL